MGLFDRLRHWAYPSIRPYWGGGLQAWNAWLSHCNSRALVYNGDFMTPLHGREVWHVARSVAKWTWKHTTPKGFSDWQAAQGRKGGVASGEARRLANAEHRAKAHQMALAGCSVREIAHALGMPVRTVAEWVA